MEILFLHQPSCGRFGFCYRLLLLTSPLYAEREAVHFRAAQAPRSSRPCFFRTFDGMPNHGSAVGRYDRSLVGTENHWPVVIVTHDRKENKISGKLGTRPPPLTSLSKEIEGKA